MVDFLLIFGLSKFSSKYSITDIIIKIIVTHDKRQMLIGFIGWS